MAERLHQAAAEHELQEELRDLLCLAVVGDHVRWVLAGAELAAFDHWLVDAVRQWRTWADQIAMYLATLGIAPDGRVRSLARDVPMNWVPDGWLQLDEALQLVSDRVRKVMEWAEHRRSQATDLETRRLLDIVCSGLEAQSVSLAGMG